MADLYIVATMTAKDGKAQELRATLLEATPKFRQEDGCLGYTLLEDRKHAGRFMTFERWRDEAALTAHMASPTMETMKPLLPTLLSKEIEQDFLDAHLIL